eukprot:scaffold74208_cov67-Phaeocystis_antarctica.AAC.2
MHGFGVSVRGGTGTERSGPSYHASTQAPRSFAPSPAFDPRDPDHFAAAASPVLRGTPAGQRN